MNLHLNAIQTTLRYNNVVSSTIFRGVRKIAKSDYQLRHVCPSLRLSTWKHSAPNGRIFMKFGTSIFPKMSIN